MSPLTRLGVIFLSDPGAHEPGLHHRALRAVPCLMETIRIARSYVTLNKLASAFKDVPIAHPNSPKGEML